MTSLTYLQLPESCLVVLIGASGAGKSTLASTWPASQVLSPLTPCAAQSETTAAAKTPRATRSTSCTCSWSAGWPGGSSPSSTRLP